jgi:hypothetical protein
MVRLSHSLQHVAYRFPGIRVVLSSVHSSLRGPQQRTTGAFAWASTIVPKLDNRP